MGGAGIEPDIENVEDLFVRLGVHHTAQEPGLGAVFVPDIRAFGLEGFDDTRVDLFVAQQEILIRRQGAFLHETGQRNTPRPLPRQHPIGARFHHRIEPVAPRPGHPVHVVDLGQRPFADRLAVHVQPVAHGFVDGGKPLGGVAVDDRRLGPPGMWVGVFDLTPREQPADLRQLVDHRGIGIALLAIGFQDRLAAEERQIVPETPVFHDVVGDHLAQHAEVTVKLVFLQTVGGRAMDKPGSFGVRHEIGGAEIA